MLCQKVFTCIAELGFVNIPLFHKIKSEQYALLLLNVRN